MKSNPDVNRVLFGEANMRAVSREVLMQTVYKLNYRMNELVQELYIVEPRHRLFRNLSIDELEEFKVMRKAVLAHRRKARIVATVMKVSPKLAMKMFKKNDTALDNAKDDER